MTPPLDLPDLPADGSPDWGPKVRDTFSTIAEQAASNVDLEAFAQPVVKKCVYVVILWGQSNMSGRGTPVSSLFDGVHPRIFQYGHDRTTIEPAVEPLRMHDYLASTAGISPGMQFARNLIPDLSEGDVVLLVPTAHGGTALSTNASPLGWRAGVSGNLLEQSIEQAEEAIEEVASDPRFEGFDVKVAAVLGHQGESDDGTSGTVYRADLLAVAGAYRARFGARVPFIMGAMAPENVAASPGRISTDLVHQNLPKILADAGFAEGVAGQVLDGTHYNAIGVRILGENYYKEYRRIVGGRAYTRVVDVPAGGTIWAEDFSGTGTFDGAAPSTAALDSLYWRSSVRITKDNGQARMSAESGAFRSSTVDGSPYSDAVLGMTYTGGTGAHPALVAGYVDADNHIRARATATEFALFKIVGGVATQVGSSYAFTRAAGDRYELVKDGDEVTIKINGTTRITGSISEFASSGRHGIGVLGSTGAIANVSGLTCERLPA